MGKGLSITAFVFSLFFFIPFVPIVGLVLGIIATRKEKQPGDLKELAIAAIILGAFGTLLSLITGLGLILTFIRVATEGTP